MIDEHGRAYVGSQAREGGVIVRVDPDGTSATVVADDLDFPNGMVITPDGATLIVAESIGRRLTAFTIDADGGLGDRRVFADGLDGPPDGIALDAEGGVWTSMTLAHQFERIVETAAPSPTASTSATAPRSPARSAARSDARCSCSSSTDAYPAATDRHQAVPARHRDRRHSRHRPARPRGHRRCPTPTTN